MFGSGVIVLVNRARRGMGMEGVGVKLGMEGSIAVENCGGLDEVTRAVGRNVGVRDGTIVDVFETSHKELTACGTAVLIGVRTRM